MKVILLAGGFGTRISEYTDFIPKPMIQVGGKPLLWHIMNQYANFNHNEFYVACGYKANVIKEYFLNYASVNSNFTVNLKNGEKLFHNADGPDWNVTVVDTGERTMTGGRLKKMREYVGNETFMLTYGDGLSDVNIDQLLSFHKSHGKMITMTAVRPLARFGELMLMDGRVESFQEKPQLHDGWINGGFFVIEPSFFDLIDNDQVMLERQPLEAAVSMNELMAYKHDGFWQCMDSKRDHDLLESLWKNGAPWTYKR